MSVNRPREVRVSVPCSTSNFGPGYDALGCAFKLYNEFTVCARNGGSPSAIEFAGPECKGLIPSADNPFFEAAARLYREARLSMPPLHIRVTANVPNARGLGSSSTAIVAGLVAANELAGRPFTRERLLEFATQIEGHPDNVSPALYGGLTAGLLTPDGRVMLSRSRVSPAIGFVVFSPDYEVSTKAARRVLPKRIPHADAVANACRLPLLLEALRRGRLDQLAVLTEDRLHEPYRWKLYRDFDSLKEAALKGGAAAVTLSGAGPSMLAMAPRDACPALAAKWDRAVRRLGQTGTVRVLEPDMRGTRVRSGKPA